jgi:cyclopropane fatty-acyl-phospholipid synthase-like methyltransferase
MDKRLQLIREEEKKYHEACYEEHKLFEEGSWLHHPVKTVMDNLSFVADREELVILDLGCGVGRNSIPMAQALSEAGGQVVCVDLLESALEKMMNYADEYGVSRYLHPVASDIGAYHIAADSFDYIVAVSSLEHVESKDKLSQVLNQMNAGTKEQGINCIVINTNVLEIDLQSNESLEPYIETNLETTEMQVLLDQAFVGWEVLNNHVKQLEFNIIRDNREILLKSDCITYVVRKNGMP